jgi:site-specific recombinase XerD
MSKRDCEVLDPWIEGYLDYIRDVRKCAAGTVRDMRCTFRRVVRWMLQKHPSTPLWKLELRDYIRWIDAERSKNASAQTLAKALSHVRGLLEYSCRSERTDRNVLDGFTLQDAQTRIEPACLTIAEAKTLVGACGKKTALERRNRVIVLLLYGCGLRTKELCGLDLSKVDVEAQEVEIKGKGEILRRIPVPDAVWVELLAYMMERGGKRGPLFRTQSKQRRIRGTDVGAIVGAMAQKAGLIKKVVPKMLRHSFGTHLIDRGVDVGVVAVLMGHRGPSETNVYLHSFDDRKREAVDRLGRRDKGETAS